MTAMTTTIIEDKARRRSAPMTVGEAKGLLSLALLSPVEIKGLGYRELVLGSGKGSLKSEGARQFMASLPLDRLASTYLRWKRADGARERRDRLKDMAIDFIVRGSYPKNAKDTKAIKEAQRELIGFALVKLGLGHLAYAKPWLPKRRKLNEGGVR